MDVAQQQPDREGRHAAQEDGRDREEQEHAEEGAQEEARGQRREALLRGEQDRVGDQGDEADPEAGTGYYPLLLKAKPNGYPLIVALAGVFSTFDMESLRHQLGNHGIAVTEIRPLAPSLEDVFVELTYKHQALLEAASD